MKTAAQALFLSIALFFGMVAIPAFAQTSAESCSCFCQSPNGAFELEKARTADACKTQCDADGARILGCYGKDDANLRPENSAICWKKQACQEEFQRRVSADSLSTTWDEGVYWQQLPQCLPEEGACYPPAQTIGLNVSLGGVDSVTGITSYVNAVYTVLIAFGAVGAVIVIMIAGLRWATARGNPSQVDAARQMIGRAITSIVILLSVVAIAGFIDPRLTRLNILRTPLIESVEFIASGSSCERLLDTYDGLKVNVEKSNQEISSTSDGGYGGIVCGDKGTVTSLGTLGEGNTVGLDVGSECIFQKCAGTAESCLKAGTEWKCARCGNITDVGPFTDVEPSASLCSSLSVTPSAEEVLTRGGEIFTCEYFNAGLLNIASSDACVEIRSQGGQNGIRCADIQKCEDYETLTVHHAESGIQSAYSSVVSGNGITEYVASGNVLPGTENGPQLLQAVCSDDPCNIGGCKLDTQTTTTSSGVSRQTGQPIGTTTEESFSCISQ